MSLPKDGQQFTNLIKETTKQYTEITDTYATFKNLGSDELYNHISIVSDLNQPISIKFASGDVITLSSETFVNDGFVHGGVIQIKYNSDAPTSGSIVMRNW